MKSGDNVISPGVGHWSVAVGEDSVAAAQALRELAASYWYPVYAWWRRVGCDAARAASATEACFTRWIDREPPRADDPGSGRFREWLLRRLPVLAVSGVKPTAHPRHAIDREWAEEMYAAEPEGAPDEILARRMAIELLEFAIETLREQEMAAGREEAFAEMLRSLAAESEPAGDPEVAGFQVRFAGDLRALVADTLLDASDVEAEIATLRSAVQQTAGALPETFGGLTPDALFAWGLVSTSPSPATLEAAPEPIAFAEIRRLFPQHDILGVIGTGCASVVYRTRQATLDRLVAIKVLPPEAGADREFAGRFLREAQAMSRLHHENIVTVFDVGESAEGHLFHTMEYVDGEALDTRLRRGALPAGAALHVAAQLCTALAHAHALGVVHGALKPANVLLNRAGVVKVADFGLTRSAALATDAPQYLAPEQQRGQAVDRRADVYAAGVLLYEMLCGEAPLGLCDAPSLRAGVDYRFDAIVQRAMQSDPERRFQSIEEMKAALAFVRDAPAATPAPVVAAPTPSVTPASARPRTPRWIAAGIAASLAAVAGLLALRPEKETLTAAQKTALARAQLPATPAPEATPLPTSAKPKPKPATRKPAAKPKPSTPVAAVALAPAPPSPAATPPPATPAPTPAATPSPISEPARWLAATSAEMQAAYRREVSDPYESESAAARSRYVQALDAAIAAASAAGRRDAVIALRTERQSVESGQSDAKAPPPSPELAPLRAQWQSQAAKVAAARTDRARALHARYDALLAQAGAKAAAAQQLDDARAIEAKRGEFTALCLPPATIATSAAPATPAIPSPPPQGRLAPLTLLARLLAMNATVEVRKGPGQPGYPVATTSDLKTDKFDWKEIEFRPRPAGGAPITDEDLAILEHLPNLPELALNGIAVTDAVIARLRELRLLRSLRLENLQGITGASAAAIAALPELRDLALVNLPLDDEAIATLARQSRLTKLRLANLPIADAALASVAAMPALEDLEFGGGKIRASSEAWSHLATMRKLTRVACRAGTIDPVLIGHLARCTALTSLNLDGRAMNDAALAPLAAALPRLEKLNLDRTKITGSAFKSWPVRPALTSLSLEDCPGLEDSVLRGLVVAFPKLDTLEIGGPAGAISAGGATELARLRALKTLCVRGEAVTDSVCSELARLDSLTHLDLGDSAITDSGLIALARLPRLSKLTLAQPPITDAALKALKKFRALKEIDLAAATPEAVLTRLRADLPGVSVGR